MESQRILKNISTLEDKIKSKDTINYKIIQMNLSYHRVLLCSYKHQFIDNKSLQENFETWFDVCYWANYLAAFTETIMHSKCGTNDKLLSATIEEVLNLSLAFAYILSRFVEYSRQTLDEPFLWLTDSMLTRKLVSLTQLIYLRTFALIDDCIIETYKDRVAHNKIQKVEVDLDSLLALWEKVKANIECEKNSETNQFDKEIRKLAASQKPQLLRVVRVFLKKQQRSKSEDWTFLIHWRNSLAHKLNKPTTSSELLLWGRLFKLEKDKPFNTYHCDQFIIFSIRALELCIELCLDSPEEQHEWAKISDEFLNIKPRHI